MSGSDEEYVLKPEQKKFLGFQKFLRFGYTLLQELVVMSHVPSRGSSVSRSSMSFYGSSNDVIVSGYPEDSII